MTRPTRILGAGIAGLPEAWACPTDGCRTATGGSEEPEAAFMQELSVKDRWAVVCTYSPFK